MHVLFLGFLLILGFIQSQAALVRYTFVVNFGSLAMISHIYRAFWFSFLWSELLQITYYHTFLFCRFKKLTTHGYAALKRSWQLMDNTLVRPFLLVEETPLSLMLSTKPPKISRFIGTCMFNYVTNCKLVLYEWFFE